LSSPFTVGFNGSQYDYVIHMAQYVSLITSFQPPLVFDLSEFI